MEIAAKVEAGARRGNGKRDRDRNDRLVAILSIAEPQQAVLAGIPKGWGWASLPSEGPFPMPFSEGGGRHAIVLPHLSQRQKGGLMREQVITAASCPPSQRNPHGHTYVCMVAIHIKAFRARINPFNTDIL